MTARDKRTKHLLSEETLHAVEELCRVLKPIYLRMRAQEKAGAHGTISPTKHGERNPDSSKGPEAH